MQIFNIVKCAYSNSKTRSFEYWVPVLWNSLPLAGHFLRVFEWEGALAKRDLPSAEQSRIADCGRKATHA